ncbi:MAG: hypothetical protein LBJ95_02995 [Oscillospiraceae bacterium]|jgi:hypothetical protein|nr:hypothetical protein [Oscillospiraceae bacterium]
MLKIQTEEQLLSKTNLNNSKLAELSLNELEQVTGGEPLGCCETCGTVCDVNEYFQCPRCMPAWEARRREQAAADARGYRKDWAKAGLAIVTGRPLALFGAVARIMVRAGTINAG